MFSVSKRILFPKKSNYQVSSIVDDLSTDVMSLLENKGILVKDPFNKPLSLPSLWDRAVLKGPKDPYKAAKGKGKGRATAT